WACAATACKHKASTAQAVRIQEIRREGEDCKAVPPKAGREIIKKAPDECSAGRAFLFVCVRVVRQILAGVATGTARLHHRMTSLQVSVAYEAVAVKGDVVNKFFCIQHASAGIQSPQAHDAVAYGYILDGHDRASGREAFQEAGTACHTVTNGAGAKERQNHVRTRFDAPYTQRHAKVVGDALGAVHGGNVDTTAQTHG